MSSSPLLKPLTVGAHELPNRIVMAPLTRMRADQPGDVPNDLMRDYYVQRAGAGLIVSEGTQISPQGKGYMDTPGIHSAEQVAGWRRVTDAVHAADGRIAAQLWHVGRVSHPVFHDGALPVSASAVDPQTRTTVKGEDGRPTRVPCPVPRALTTAEVGAVVADYHRAAVNAREAGFDYAEVHGAHGYLIHQFLSTSTNLRDDRYGGSTANRARFALEVLEAVVSAWDADHVAMRISPKGVFGGLDDRDGGEMGLLLAREMSRLGIAFLHLSEPDWAGGPAYDDDYRAALRSAFPGVIVTAGNYDVAKAERILGAGYADAVAFGRAFIANPDLPERIRRGAALNEPDTATFYGGGAEGYTDYPSLDG